MYEPVEIEVEENPDDAVGKEYPDGVDAAGEEIVHQDEEGCKGQHEGHDMVFTKTSTQKLVVEVVLVGLKGMVASAQATDDHTDDIEEGDDKR